MNVDHCCVCLNSFCNFKELAKKDVKNLSIFEKLTTNVPEIKWKEDDLICDPCISLLDVVNTFRETCLKSEKTRKQWEVDQQIKDEGNFFKFENDEDYFGESDSTSDNGDSRKNGNFKGKKKEDPIKCEENKVGAEKEAADDEEGDKDDSRKRKRQTKNLTFECELCSHVSCSSTRLVKHCVEKHGIDSKSVRPFPCDRCDSRFSSSSNLLQHIKYHNAVRSNMCTFCGKGFITKTDLNIHEKQHLNKREYQCESCSKSFNTHKDLRSHKLVVHTDPMLWKHFCELCNKRFPIKSNYDCHMRRHSGDKKFECSLCEKKFTDKCVMQRHLRTHSNVREWKCAHCVKEYKDKRVLQIHMAKVHEIGVGVIKLPIREKKYICHICPKAYYAKNKLTRHLNTHSGEKPFYCTVCNKNFNDKSYVKKHMQKLHNVDIKSEVTFS